FEALPRRRSRGVPERARKGRAFPQGERQSRGQKEILPRKQEVVGCYTDCSFEGFFQIHLNNLCNLRNLWTKSPLPFYAGDEIPNDRDFGICKTDQHSRPGSNPD